MALNIRSLGDKGGNLLTELSRQGKRIFTIEDAAKIYGSGDGRLRKQPSSRFSNTAIIFPG